MDLEVAGGADAGDVVVAHDIRHGEGAVDGDVGVEGNDIALGVHVGDGVVGGSDLLGGLGKGGVEVAEGAHVAAVGLLVGQVGGDVVDGVGGFVAHVGAGFLRHGDQVGGGHDILVVQVDQADGALVGHREGHGLAQLQGDVLRASHVLDVPGLVVVSDEDAGAALGAHGVVDAGQQVHGLLGGGALAQQHGGDLSFLDAGLLVEGVNRLHSLAAAGEGLGGRDAQAHLIGTARLVGGVGMGAAAVRAEAGEVVIGEGGVAVAVLGEGVGEAVAALVDVASLMQARGRNVEHLVVAVGDILAAGEHGGAVSRQLGADINSGAGGRAHSAQAQDQRHNQRQQGLHVLHKGLPSFRDSF